MIRVAALGFSLFALTAPAAELEGVKLPDTAPVEGKALKLNGIGVRAKGASKVYVAALYLEKGGSDADAIIAADAARRLDVQAKRDMPNVKIVEAIEATLEKNVPDQTAAFKDRFTAFSEAVPDTRKGETMTLSYAPGKGLTVSLNGAPRGTIPGKDFADAVFLAWLGKTNVDDALKKALLGGK